jgi:hypothetical protein
MIDIGTVLKKFDDLYDERSLEVRDFGVRFITSDGRLRTMQCRKNVKSPKQKLRAPLRARAKGQFHLQRHGAMQVHDVAINETRTIKVATIFGFKDFKSSNWQTVRH